MHSEEKTKELLDKCPKCGHEPSALQISFNQECDNCGHTLIKSS